jgi:integrase
LLNAANITLRIFKPALKRAGIRQSIRLYDLRHTTATLLLQAGVNPKTVSERLGHSTIMLTMDVYSHILPNMQQDATEKLEGMLFKSSMY